MSKIAPELSMWMRQVEIRLAMLEKTMDGLSKLLDSITTQIGQISIQILDEMLRKFK